MTMLASTPIRLKPSIIAKIGLIVNSEQPHLRVSQSHIKTDGEKTSEEAFRFGDCRMFRELVRLQSLYGSTSFMNPKTYI